MTSAKQSQVLFDSVVAYFTDNRLNHDKMLSICDGTSDISLRMLDWLCTNFAKSNMGLDSNNTSLELYHRYKNNLRGFGKRFFDPFCRRQDVQISLHGKSFKTTIGQLNFFKWAFENELIQFALTHKSEIEKHMNERLHHSKATHSQNKRDDLAENNNSQTECQKRKRAQLSKLASNHCTKKVRLIRVSFS
tara:strand:+ start:612 stop:1184 length:573 start_codon:yes stop_codon:yes gene_type:complete